MVVEMENLSWDERRELRRQKRHKSLQAISRDVPDRAQIQERRLKSQQKTEERKKKKEVLEAALNQEEKARLERQKRREEKRKSREFDPEYIERVNAAIMSRIKAPPSPDFMSNKSECSLVNEPSRAHRRNRTGSSTRRSLLSMQSDNDLYNGHDLKRTYASDVEKGLQQACRLKLQKYKDNSSSSSANGQTTIHNSFKMECFDRELNSVSASSISECEPMSSSFNGNEKIEPLRLSKNDEMAFNVNEQDNLITTDTTTTSDPVAPTPELSDESLDENIDDAFNELQVDEQVVEPIVEPMVEPMVAEVMESEPPSPIPPQPTEIETEPEIKLEINNEPVDNEKPPTPVERRPSHEKLLAAKTAVYESEPPVTQPPPPKEMPQVGSINDRLNKYQSASSLLDEEKQPDSPVTRPNQPKVGKLTDRKDSYLKQANNASSPSHAAPVRMASSGLMERMKQLEDSSKGGTLVRRETVNMGERASDIKSRINGWGKANTTDNVLR